MLLARATDAHIIICWSYTGRYLSVSQMLMQLRTAVFMVPSPNASKKCTFANKVSSCSQNYAIQLFGTEVVRSSGWKFWLAFFRSNNFIALFRLALKPLTNLAGVGLLFGFEDLYSMGYSQVFQSRPFRFNVLPFHFFFQQDNYAWSHHASASIQPGELSEVEHGRGRSQSPVNRIYRHDIISDSETRSELLIHNTSVYDNGTYRCEAKNKAALSVSNFTLHVTDHIDTPKILQVRQATNETRQRGCALKLNLLTAITLSSKIQLLSFFFQIQFNFNYHFFLWSREWISSR